MIGRAGRGLTFKVGGGLGDGVVARREGEHAHRLRPDRDEGMRHTGRNGDGVVGLDHEPLVAEPDVEPALQQDEDLVDAVVHVQRCTGARLDHAVAGDAGQALPGARPRLDALAQGFMADAAARERPGDFAQALFDLGATICTARNPACALCPWMVPCQARAAGLQ